jgi:hypothetical protein
MENLEKLGAFYLGKAYDLEKGEILDRPVMYDARDLTTHGVCVGMTGSGKTGLCIDLLEEAALDSVPAIIIDPKGDVTNLLLTFPELRPEDFLPWVNVDDARRKGKSLEEYAQDMAELWRAGLADWDQGPERIQRLKDSAEFLIYTPGSDAGLPVSILHSFAAPSLAWDEHEETLREQVQGTVSALLGLVGIEADPVRSREHILLSHIFEHAWREGEDLDMARLIGLVQTPPMRKLGVFDLDTFFPQKDRFELAMALNNLIAAPGFERWMEGQSLDIDQILHGPGGKPRMSIFYIAHLSEAERMFFVTLLLQQIVTWMRGQAGTTSLRALVYFDEVFGYFPPVAEPPSKRPMLTLLKQARAFGLGMMLTTQNPVDVDYKGLTNTGTWFIGKLQTERDKMRVLEGLESAIAEVGTLLDRNYLDKLISSLGSRVFILHNVHEDRPQIFYTRWAMSYLRGPLTRRQVQELMRDVEVPVETVPEPSGDRPAPTKTRPGAAEGGALPAGLSAHRPTLPPDVEQVFLPVQLSQQQAVGRLAEGEGKELKVQEGRVVYEPAVLGIGSVQFVNRKYEVNERRDVALLLQPPESRAMVRWEEAESLDLDYRDLDREPSSEALFADVPPTLTTARKLSGLSSALADYLYRHEALVLGSIPSLGLVSQPGESPRDFAVRSREGARERRDAEVDELSAKYEKKIDVLQDRLRREERELTDDAAELAARKREELLSAGESVIGLFIGRRSTRGLSTASRRRRFTTKAKSDVEETEATIADLQDDIAKLQAGRDEEAEEITRRWADALDELGEERVTPRRTDVDVEMLALAWAPHWEITYEDARGRERTDSVPAYVSDQGN